MAAVWTKSYKCTSCDFETKSYVRATAHENSNEDHEIAVVFDIEDEEIA